MTMGAWQSSENPQALLDVSECHDRRALVMEINDASGRRVIINRKPEIFESHYYHRFPLVFTALDSRRDFFYFIAVFCL